MVAAIESRFNSIDSELKIIKWMLVIATVIPFLKQLLS